MDDVTDTLERALDRIDAFRAIHEPGGVSMEAARCLFEAVGISEEALGLIGERIFADEGIRDGASAFFGVIVGLLAADLVDG